MTQGCVINLTQGHISKVKVTVHTYPKSVSGPYLFIANLMGMVLHLIVVHDTGVVVAGGICPVRTCLDLSVYIETLAENLTL